MELQDLIAEWRRQVDDLAQPYLWDDEEGLRYAVDAQDKYVRLTGGIPDATTTAITDVSVDEDTPFTAHSPYILRIRSAKLLTARRSIDLLNEADLRTLVVHDYGFTIPQYLDDEDKGEVTAAVLGVSKNKIRWYKVPAADDTCRMNVYRLPYPRIADQDDALEIDEQHHRHLILWMKHLAYSKQDAETYDKAAAEENKVAFEQYCEGAKSEEERQRYKPRTVQYGGIR